MKILLQIYFNIPLCCMSNDMDLNHIIQSTECLHLTSEEQRIEYHCNIDDNGNNCLLGDNFQKTWDLNKLTLPSNPSPLINYKVCSEKHCLLSKNHIYSNAPFACSDVISAKFKHLTCITKGNAKTVYQATLGIKTNNGLRYCPGDSISIFPENDSQTVSWLLHRLTLDSLQDADTLFTIELMSTQTRNIPTWLLPGRPVTLRYLLTYCCELYIPVTRRILRLLADHCFDCIIGSANAEKQRNRLLEFSSQEGRQMFEMYIQTPNLNLLDILFEFQCCRLPFIRLLEILPRLQPRSYTLINPVDESVSYKQDLSFIFTRVDLKYPISEADTGVIHRYPYRHHGICTGWLERIWFGVNQPDDYQKANFINMNSPIINVYLRRNLIQFSLPEVISQPVIMIGAGSGIAPFISFIRQRKRDYLKDNTLTGDLWLIYGCRSPTTSLLFENELSDALNSKILKHLCLCFSRDTVNSPSEKYALNEISSVLIEQACFPLKAHYVQECIFYKHSTNHKLSEHDIQLMNLVYERNAKIMVCGEARQLAPEVFQSWIQLIAMRLHYEHTKTWCSYSDLSEENFKNAQEYLQSMRKAKRYQEDVWV
ncbi:Methionine synthase reductase [Schistosoma japonicum]|nr:Methionine synthase reductase [Schistosoma japonicum]